MTTSSPAHSAIAASSVKCSVVVAASRWAARICANRKPCGVCAANSLLRSSVAAIGRAVRRALDRVGHRRRRAGRRHASRAPRCTPLIDVAVDQRPRGILDQDEVRLVLARAPARPCEHRLLPRLAASHRRQEPWVAEPKRGVALAVVGMDHRQRRRRRPSTASMASMVRARTGFARQHPVLLGVGSPSALARSPVPAATTIAAMIGFLAKTVGSRRAAGKSAVRGLQPVAGCDKGSRAITKPADSVALAPLLTIVRALSGFERIWCSRGGSCLRFEHRRATSCPIARSLRRWPGSPTARCACSPSASAPGSSSPR